MRILVGLLEHIGDIVACEPVVRYLRLEYPGSHIAWAVSPVFRELIDTNPHIDQTVVLECLTDWIKLTKHRAYDKVVDLHVSGRVCQHCGIPLVKSSGNPFVNIYEWFDYGSLVEAFTIGAGLPRITGQPRLYLQEEHQKAVDRLALPDQFCAIHVQSNDTTKDWRKQAWRELCEFIRDRLQLQIVEVGAGQNDGPVLPDGMTSLVNRLPILQTAEVIRRARCFVGVDSGPAHLANATQTPSVVLLGEHYFFKKYMPFSGFFASNAPQVKMVRNLTGPVASLTVSEVIEAVNYVVTAGEGHRKPAAKEAAANRANELAPLAVSSVLSVLRDESVSTRSESTPVSLDRQAGFVPTAVSSSSHKVDRYYPRTFAFYLPQFHPIRENDWAHGSGFSEWHNVIRAKPLYEGHYQPRIPGELGFYDLRSSAVMEQQIALARRHGISGFCFYYYYFQGKKLLYDPIANFIKSDIDFPFFLLWANENWSKRWDGGDLDVIIAQRHSWEDDLAFIRGVMPVFEDDRYVKVAGKPLLLIYKPHLFPDIRATTEIWRSEAEKHGLPGLYLIMADDWNPQLVHPRAHGFDASYEIPSNIVPEEVLYTDLEALQLQPEFEGQIVDYSKFAAFHMGRPFPDYRRFRTVMLPWDNTPRYGSRAIVHINNQTDAYRLWLIEALLDTCRRYPPDERIVFLHSWNEWCEGTYLEPDQKFGRKFLRQTSEAIGVVRRAIDMIGADAEHASAMTDLLQMMDKKDEGALRVMWAARRQQGYLHAQLQGELQAELQAQRAEFHASTSWRVTAPLRAVARRLGRG
jgi:ADP-heptose:LPS heptosyltransferase